MREILLTSSVLILALLILRRVFRQKIARRVQYALWGLVLVRLLVPVSLPAFDFSVLTMAEPVRESIATRLEAPAFTAPVIPISGPQSPYPAAVEPTIPGTPPDTQPPAAPAEAPAGGKDLTGTEVLGLVWLTGTAAMTVWLLASNLSFAVRLRSRRITAHIPGCRRRVYMVESGLASPCLFGILRPAIYLTPSAVRSEESLRHVLAHEETHARHLDPLWSLLRSVCLAVYWFDPLVWIAASASKTDCELACDEGAIRLLGEEERLAYGRTLLSLIPVRRLPGNPLLSATTMSSDKKRLRDRVTRIAENRQTRKLALCAMALLTAGACVLTFAGCAEQGGKDPSGVPGSSNPRPIAVKAEKRDGPITAAELRYFNEQFFNGNYMNIHNQFLSSIYETAADIDLFELFYCGSGRNETMTDEEWTAFEEQGGFIDTDVTKLSTAGADAVLLENTGLTLEETGKVGLGNFTYLPEFDAYFYGHGDTNYRRQVDIAAGEREGDLVRLYYDDTFYADGWKCVTLRETEGGGYQFVSNVYSEKPAVPTVYPVGEPLAAVPLTDMGNVPWKAHLINYRSRDLAELVEGKELTVDGNRVVTYRSIDGHTYVARVLSEDPWQVDEIYMPFDDNFSLTPADDILGFNGFSIDLDDCRMYYAFAEDGKQIHLIHVPGANMDVRSIDLDGNGISEMLKEALPGESVIQYLGIDPYARCLTVRTSLWVDQEDGPGYMATPTRNIYFDGENLLVYAPDKTASDHISAGVAGPEELLDIFWQTDLEFIQGWMQDESLKDAQIDGWRVVSVDGPYYESFEDLTVRLYRFVCELHAAAPQNVALAGGMYMDEDGWFGNGHSSYIGFMLAEDGSWDHWFYSPVLSVEPWSEAFHENVEQALADASLLEPTPAQEVQASLDRIMENDYVVLQLRRSKTDSKSIVVSPDEGNARNRQLYFTDPSSYAWTETGSTLPAGDPAYAAEELTVASPAGDVSLTFFSGSERVLCREGDTTRWFRAENLCGPEDAFYDRSDIFNYMRQLFDENEGTESSAAIPDDGRSREEIAQAWAEAYEGTALRLTETNRYHCTYVDVRDVEIDEERPQEFMPEYPGAKDVFLIWYSVVFVPDDWRCHMAGNTAEYEGNDAPEGAYQYWRCAYLRLDEDGYWRSDGAGTGP